MQAPASTEMQLIPPAVTMLSVVRSPQMVIDEAVEAAKALKSIIDAKPRPFKIRGETYLQYEDWQTVGRFYGVCAKVVDTKAFKFGGVSGFSARAEAIMIADGRVISAADAMCSTDEPKWNTRPVYVWNEEKSKRVRTGEEKVPIFQLRSMAQTRACAKALRNVLAWVVVLAGYKPTPAEELDGQDDFNQENQHRAICSGCGIDLYDEKEIADSRKKYGTATCKVCVRKIQERKGDEILAPMKDPEFIQKSVEKVKAIRDSTIRGVTA